MAKSKTPITDSLVAAMKARTTSKDYYTLCCELEQSHARLLAALKYISNDEKGSFEGWENNGVNIQRRLERAIRLAEKLFRNDHSSMKLKPPFKVVHSLHGAHRKNDIVIGVFETIEEARSAADNYADTASKQLGNVKYTGACSAKSKSLRVNIYDAQEDIPVEQIQIDASAAIRAGLAV